MNPTDKFLLCIHNFNVPTPLLMSDVIPDNFIKFSVASMTVQPGVIRLYLGGNKPNSYIKNTDFKFKSSVFLKLSKLVGQLYIDGANKIAKLKISIDDLSALYEISLQYIPGSINMNTLIYNHPAVNNVRVNVLNPRVNSDTQKYIVDTGLWSRSYSTDLCKSFKNCQKCLYVPNTKLSCTRCAKGYQLINNICYKETN